MMLELSTLANSRTVKEMDKESFIFRMEVIMKVHGRTIRCMERVAFTI
jgi:hypothetical protein